jgi:hypothetical protein
MKELVMKLKLYIDSESKIRDNSYLLLWMSLLYDCLKFNP